MPDVYAYVTIMALKMSIYCLITSFGLFATLSGKSDLKELGDMLNMPTEQINSIMQSPMPDLGKVRLARILARYYNDGLGGAEQWDQISSLKLKGTLKLEEVESFENGEWVSSLALNDFKVNAGVMSWMFKINH